MSDPAKPMETLHPETIAASKQRQLSGAFEGKRLLKILGELAKIDESTGAVIEKTKKRGVAMGIATFAGFFGGMFFTAFTGFWMVFAIPLVTGVLAAKDMIGVNRMKKRDDLLDDFRVLIRPVLRDILDDLDPEKKVKVRFDLTGMADSKQVSKKELPPGRFQKLTETVQKDPWCELRLPLADGSLMTLEVTNEYHKIERRYKGRSGKIKWKSKWRKEAEVSASLLPPAGVKWNESAKVTGPDERLRTFEKDGVTGKCLQHYWSFKDASESVASVCPPPREVVGMMLRLHNALAGGSQS